MDIIVKPRGKNFWVIPQTESARTFMRLETGAIPYAWSVQVQEGEFLRLNRKEKDTYEFLDYLMAAGYDVVTEDV
jgi:hypothetical protein